MLSKGSKRKIDDTNDQHSDFHLDENIESESDQSTNMPKKVKTKKKMGLLRYLMYLINTSRNKKG